MLNLKPTSNDRFLINGQLPEMPMLRPLTCLACVKEELVACGLEKIDQFEPADIIIVKGSSSSAALGFAFVWANTDDAANTINKETKRNFFMSNYIKKQFAGEYQ